MLNDLVIRKLPLPQSGVVQYPDGKIPGFGIRVTATGVKSFYLTFRYLEQSRRLNLGRYPATSLQQARARAFAALSGLGVGVDPSGAEIVEVGETFESALEAFVTTH